MTREVFARQEPPLPGDGERGGAVGDLCRSAG